MDDTSGTTSTSTAAANNTPTAAPISAELKATMSAADTSVSQGVQFLGLVHQARLSQANRNLAALTAKYGASDPRVKAAQASVTATTTTIARVSLVGLQIAVPVVQAAAAGWALHGLVVDAQLQPASKFTVFLVDGNKNFLQQYGFSYSDDNGYFLINYAGDTPPAPPLSNPEGTAPAETTTPRITEATPPPPPNPTPVPNPTPAPATTATQLYIGIADTDANPVYLSARAFQPVLGSATFQNILLPAGGQPIGDPPAAIRAVALPKQAGSPQSATKSGAKSTPKRTTK